VRRSVGVLVHTLRLRRCALLVRLLSARWHIRAAAAASAVQQLAV